MRYNIVIIAQRPGITITGMLADEFLETNDGTVADRPAATELLEHMKNLILSKKAEYIVLCKDGWDIILRRDFYTADDCAVKIKLVEMTDDGWSA